MTTKSFQCPECGGHVAMRPAKGLTWALRPGHPLPVPSSVKVPTCDGCGESYLGPEDSKNLTRAVRKQALAEQAAEVRQHVEVLQKRHGVTLRQIEAALAVTPSYVSHLMAGRKLASETLLRLLALFVKHPVTFRHPVLCPEERASPVWLAASFGKLVSAWGPGARQPRVPTWNATERPIPPTGPGRPLDAVGS